MIKLVLLVLPNAMNALDLHNAQLVQRLINGIVIKVCVYVEMVNMMIYKIAFVKNVLNFGKIICLNL